MNAITTTVNEVVEAIKKDHEKEIAAKNVEISTLKAKIVEARIMLGGVVVHLNRTSTGLDHGGKPSKLILTHIVEEYIASIRGIQP
jgi:hypothetical protein